MNILLVEDEAQIVQFVREGLMDQKFSVDVCMDGEDGLARALEGDHDAIVLDIMLPRRDGLSILRELRRRGRDVPVILLTARDGLDDRVGGLDEGADDYLTKPFYVEELVARLRALVRRSGVGGGAAGGDQSIFEAGDLSLNRLTRSVACPGGSPLLTPREFSLLEFLMRQPGHVYTRPQILEHVWEYHFDPKTNIVDVYIQRVRSKLADVGAKNVIQTVRGVGYRVLVRAS